MNIMNLRTKRLRVVLAGLLIASAAATTTSVMARDAVLEQLPKTSYPATQNADLKAAREAIVRAASGLGWELREESVNQLKLHYNKQGKHMVNIAVDYDATGYTIRYLNSINLNHSVGNDGALRIHPNYNRWVRNLIKHINIQPIGSAQ